MKKILVVMTVLTLASIGLSSYLLINIKKESKRAYVINQLVFDAFKGTQRLENDLKDLASKHKAILDSMTTNSANDEANVNRVKQLEERFKAEQQRLSVGYTEAIWKDINQYLSTYGEENGFEFIYGATGEGTLMYANEINNITEDVIKYINQRYEAD